MAKIEPTELTPEQIAEYASKNVITMAYTPNSRYLDTAYTLVSGTSYYNLYFNIRYSSQEYLEIGRYWNVAEKKIVGQQFSHGGRIIGLIIGDNDDGTFKVALLGNGNLTCAYTGTLWLEASAYMINADDYQPLPIYNPSSTSYGGSSVLYREYKQYGETNHYTIEIITTPSTDHYFKWIDGRYINERGILFNTGEYQGNDIFRADGNTSADSEYTLTTDKTQTLVLGKPMHYNAYVKSDEDILAYTSGDMYDNLNAMYQRLLNRYPPSTSRYELLDGVVYSRDTDHAFNIQYYNLILTRDEAAAIRYIEDGTIPADAIINPIDDPDKMVPPDGDDDDDGGDDGAENGDNSRDTEPTPTVDLTIAPQQISGNNMYWIQAGQLHSFITWFWTQAGDVASLDDLWDKIQGLYENLSQTVLNVKFFPIDPEWVGGTTEGNNIVVGNIAMEMSDVYRIGQGKPIVRDIGSVNITEKYKSFCDYSPYAQLSLYLPFVGFTDIDVDMFMNHKLSVKAVYDIMSGTIQYMVYCDDYMVNSTIGKMAVDIPINLQSKNDRNNAVITNVTGMVSSLLTTGAVATGAIGGEVTATALAVGASHTVGQLANQQGAPMRVTGNTGETGAFYAPQKCAIYLRRPSYNRPDNYGKHVGYPTNKKYKLSTLTGFTKLANAHIDFTGDVKLTDSEIDELYSILEGGFYL